MCYKKYDRRCISYRVFFFNFIIESFQHKTKVTFRGKKEDKNYGVPLRGAEGHALPNGSSEM